MRKEVKIAAIIIKFVVPISQNKNKINGIILINEYNFPNNFSIF